MHSVAWNCEGTKVASGSVDQTARVWNLNHSVRYCLILFTSSLYNVFRKARLNSKDIQIVLINCVGTLHKTTCWLRLLQTKLCACGIPEVCYFCMRCFYDWLSAGKNLQTIKTNGENINVAYSPDGRHIAVGNKVNISPSPKSEIRVLSQVF